jgi:hypothetical protein
MPFLPQRVSSYSPGLQGLASYPGTGSPETGNPGLYDETLLGYFFVPVFHIRLQIMS